MRLFNELRNKIIKINKHPMLQQLFNSLKKKLLFNSKFKPSKLLLIIVNNLT